MTLQFIALDTELAKHFRAEGVDAYGRKPERAISDGNGNPCRHCMKDIPDGREMLVLSHRPFTSEHPYAETGPILLCADDCEAFGASTEMPDAVASRADFIVRGYSADEVIVEGTGKVTAVSNINNYAETLLNRKEVASVHIRSSSNNCFFCKVEEV